MSDSDKGSRRIKVVDRRRFDEQGELRPDHPKPKSRSHDDQPQAPPTKAMPSSQKAEPKVDSPPQRPAASGSENSSAPKATSPQFMDLVAGLAQQAEILLTGAQGLPAQPAEAQRIIEMLTMLESKTSGNLSTEESQVLSSVIFQLRTLYVKHRS